MIDDKDYKETRSKVVKKFSGQILTDEIFDEMFLTCLGSGLKNKQVVDADFLADFYSIAYKTGLRDMLKSPDD